MNNKQYILKAMEIARNPYDIECVATVLCRTLPYGVEINMLEIRQVIKAKKRHHKRGK